MSQLIVYPVKALNGVPVSSLMTEKRGFRGDRRWAIVDKQGVLLTHREEPELGRISVGLSSNFLVFKGQAGSVVVEHDADRFPDRAAIIHGCRVPACDCGDSVASWLRSELDRNCRLVYLPTEAQRDSDISGPRSGDMISYADGYPFALASQRPVGTVNVRLDRPTSTEFFRPNVIISGCESWSEGDWRVVQVGRIKFRNLRPASRAVVLDQNAIQAQQVNGPATSTGNCVFAGVHLMSDREGALCVGDSAEVIE